MVIAPKHVGAFFNVNFNIVFLRQLTYASVGE
jgi:hypothetical protein